MAIKLSAKEQQAYDQLKQQTLQQAAPYLYDVVGDKLKDQPEPVKVAVHGLIGGLVSKALGGEFGSGAAGVAAATAAIMLLDDNLGSLGVEPGTRDKMLPVVGMAIAKIVGGDEASGNAAAATAGMADAYNRQLHPEAKALARRIAATSGGQFTEKQIENALRLAGIKDSNVKPDTQETVPDVRTPGALYDGANMEVSGVSAIEKLPPPEANVIAYVRKLTGGDNSPYYWSTETSMPTASGGSDDSDLGPRYYTCATTTCLLYGANRNPNNPINRAEDQRQKEMVYAAGTIIGGPLLATPGGQALLLANGGAGLIGGMVNAAAQGLTGGWSNINYFDVGVSAVTGYFGAASQTALISRYGAGALGQTASIGAATSINVGGVLGGNWAKGDSNSNISGTIGGTLVGYPVGYYFGTANPALGAFSGAVAQELFNIGAAKITPSSERAK